MHLELPRGCAAAQVSFTFSRIVSPSSAKYAHILFIGLLLLSPPHRAPVTPNWPAVRNACTFIRIANNFKQKLPGTRPSSSLPPSPPCLRQPPRNCVGHKATPFSGTCPGRPPSPFINIIGIIIVACSGWGVAARTTSPLALVNAKSQGWHKCCPSTWPSQAGPGQ